MSSQPSQYRAVGIVLAVGSGVLIGSSFVLKKKGLLRSQAGHVAGEGVAYLKSPMWWCGMTLMILGELCNFGAYAFVEAILVTPMGALSVVICAILSHFFLNENLTLFGWIGCAQCIIGSIIIAINAPQQQSVTTIDAFKHLFLAPGFLSFGSVVIAAALVIIFFVAPKYGKKSMLWYISICSLIGGISVSCTQGLGACIVTSIGGNNQFKNWFIYFLLVFVAITLLTELFYLNVALALFNTAMVTPTYYVLFTFCTLVTSVILYQGLKASAEQILTIAFAFLIICTGIFLLQMSKIDPVELTHAAVDRKTSILLQATRQEVKLHDVEAGRSSELDEKEKEIEATEEPGLDALAGRFGGLGGSIIRARRRATIAGHSLGRSRRRRETNITPTNDSTVNLADTSNRSTAVTEAEKMDELRREVQTKSTDYPKLPSAFASKSSNLLTVPEDNGAIRGEHSGLPISSQKIISSYALVGSPTGTPLSVSDERKQYMIDHRNRSGSDRDTETGQKGDWMQAEAGTREGMECGESMTVRGSTTGTAASAAGDSVRAGPEYREPTMPSAALLSGVNTSLPTLHIQEPSSPGMPGRTASESVAKS